MRSQRIALLLTMFVWFPALSQTDSGTHPERFATTQHPQHGLEAGDEESSTNNLIRREQWFLQQRAFPGKRIPTGARHRALDQKRLMRIMQESNAATISAGAWTQIGPQPSNGYWGASSGRATTVVFDPRNNRVAYAGTAGGGVWRTTDGVSWSPISDLEPSLAIGAIALDPANPSVIYVGTGEENYSIDSYYGEGILKSTNGGSSWTSVVGPFADSEIGTIAVSPANSSVVLAGATGFTSTMWPGGLFRSSDGGSTWAMVLSGNTDSIVFDPVNTSTAFAGLGNWGDSFSGVYKSVDNGATWTKLTSGLPPATSTGRIGLVIDPNHNSVVYASIADIEGGSGYAGIYQSTDGGANWSKIYIPSGSGCCTWYENGIAVDKANSKVIVTGGFGVTRSLDGGATWSDITSGTHPDQHAFAFSPDGTQLYAANDGGLWSMSNPAASTVSWNSMNSQVATITFYPGIGMDPADVNHALAGTQDNSADAYAGNLGWNAGFSPCGDASSAMIDPTNFSHQYLYCIGTIYASSDGGATWASAMSGLNSSDGGGWVSPLALDPSNPSTLYFAAHSVYQSTDKAATWHAISGSLDTQLINAIAVAPSNSSTVYVGAGDGAVLLTKNAGTGATWTSVSTGLPARAVTSLAVSATSPATAYVTFSGFGAGHIWKTTNYGSTWTDISGNLPDAPANDVVIDPDMSNVLYLATDVGVFATSNGSIWSALGSGLPEVVVQSIAFHHGARTLRAITHGRSAWDVQIPNAAGLVLSPSLLNFATVVATGGKSTGIVTITNSGGSSVSLGARSISGANASDFADSTTTCTATLAPANSCKQSIRFAPHTIGQSQASFTLATSSFAPSPVALKGAATASATPSTVAFRNVAVKTSAQMTLTLSNKGTAGATLKPPVVGGTNASDFSIVSSTCGTSFPPSGSCSVVLKFIPSTNTARSAVLKVPEAGSNGVFITQSVSLTGTGTLLKVLPASLAFSGTSVGSVSAARTVTVTNTSASQSVSISKIAFSGADASDFVKASTSCGVSLAAGASCTIKVEFKPKAIGTRTGVLDITNSGGGTNETVSVVGTGK
jgi:hypothetical protein